ncbi:FRG domain-containing protein [Shinella fusca]|uniref:FRG domain-containing protein n=1 Tax=Shinella fusca TaxID=544480 RepID=A0A7W7YZ31_9HYPH|nr:FRG domain-containing protein [Shinella fusca]MBB5044996.1 hypothetical protein [Shinella fusca]
MYNLIMAAVDSDWNAPIGVEMEATFDLSRFLEYTEETLAQIFKPVSDTSLQFLSQLPAVFMSELDRNEQGQNIIRIRIGRVWDVGLAGRSLTYRFRIERDYGTIPVADRKTIEAAFELGRFELTRTHWAIKNADLFSALTAAGLASPVVAPTVIPPPPSPPAAEYPIVHTVEDFLGHVLGLPKGPDEEIFYRGHANRSYKLEPSLFRTNPAGEFKHLRQEDILVRELLTAHANDFAADPYMLDRLVRMQHFGLPTRLLDVSSNPLVALYFACSGAGVDGEVIMLKTKSSDVQFYDSDKVSCIANLCLMSDAEKNRMDTKSDIATFASTTAGEKLLNFVRREKPYFTARILPSDLQRILFVRGRNLHERIQAQSGAFLLFGKDAILEETGHSSLNVQRVVVRNKGSILDQLDRLNIKSSTIYPGIDKTATDIARKHEVKSGV